MSLESIFGDICRTYVCKFLDLNAIVRWDRAMLNKRLRSHFHETLRNAPAPDIPRQYSKHSQKENGVVNWILKREFDVVSLELPYDIYLRAVLDKILDSCPNLKSLSIYNNNKYPEAVEGDVFEVFSQRFHGLESLASEVEFIGLQSLIAASPLLSSFKFSAGGVTSSLYTNNIISQACQCAQLTSLVLTNAVVSGPTIQHILHSCQQLRYIEIIKIVIEEPITTPVQCVLLETLRFMYTQGDFVNDLITAIVSVCPTLNRIDLIGSEITDTTLTNMGSYCTQLTFLSLSQCALINNAGVSALVSHCSDLLTLHFDNCKTVSDNGIIAVGRHCHKLQRLWLQALDITDDSLDYIAEGCKQLRELKLAGCKEISDEGVIEIAKHCTFLRILNISQCITLTDKSLKAIANSCHALTSLHMTHCRKVTQNGLAEILSKCVHLERLDMSRCSRVTSFQFFQSVNCRHLKYLHLVGYHLINDDIVNTIPPHFKNLDTIWLNGTRITEDAIVSLVVGCPNLRTIHARSCPTISYNMVHACKLRGTILIADSASVKYDY